MFTSVGARSTYIRVSKATLRGFPKVTKTSSKKKAQVTKTLFLVLMVKPVNEFLKFIRRYFLRYLFFLWALEQI